MKRPLLHGSVVGVLIANAIFLWIYSEHGWAVITGALGLIFAGFDVYDMVIDMRWRRSIP